MSLDRCPRTPKRPKQGLAAFRARHFYFGAAPIDQIRLGGVPFTT
jgi:hypothetical protein